MILISFNHVLNLQHEVVLLWIWILCIAMKSFCSALCSSVDSCSLQCLKEVWDTSAALLLVMYLLILQANLRLLIFFSGFFIGVLLCWDWNIAVQAVWPELLCMAGDQLCVWESCCSYSVPLLILASDKYIN